MRAEIITAGLLVATAVIGVRYLDTKVRPAEAGVAPQTEGAVATIHAPQTTASADKVDIASYYAARPKEVRIKPGAHNQYFLTADVNRRPFSFLVDTGASYVALRQSDAAGAGVRVAPSDFNQPVRTANGETRAALVRIDRIEIGDIAVDNVDAFILPDQQLGVNLLGMSFLSRINSVEASGGELVLRG